MLVSFHRLKAAFAADILDVYKRQLEKRAGQVKGVVVTGGEPTLQPDLIYFISKLKELGLLVKLDTNGSNPDVLGKLIDRKLIDYSAMDIKAPLDKYSITAGRNVDIDLSLIHI